MDTKLNPYSSFLLEAFEVKEDLASLQEGMRVNPIVSELATWYEKLRNAMDYREEEVVLRAAIERILKRRHFYGGNGKTIATPLLRELVWARYFPDGSISEDTIQNVEEIIEIYLSLKTLISQKHKMDAASLNDFMYHLISSHLTYALNKNEKRETMTNFMFHIMKEHVIIEDDAPEVKDVQVFIGVRRAFAKDDIALVHYHLFTQYFGVPSKDTIEQIADDFLNGYQEIEKQLKYPLRHKIFAFLKRNCASFLVLEEILLRHIDNPKKFVQNEVELKEETYNTCKEKYNNIRAKVNRAIVRSIIFVLLTKTFIALTVEGTVERVFYGSIMWSTISLNIAIPPIILGIASLFIKTPNDENTENILKQIKVLLFNDNPKIARIITLHKNPRKNRSLIFFIITLLWPLAFIASFGLVLYGLNLLHFNLISQIVFVFFLTIISFLIYRIYQTAHTYTVLRKQTVITPVIDFFFMPIARVGRHLTEGVSHINVLLFIFDFIIEAPFKGLFAFFEQWFMFLHSKREYMD